MSAETDRIAELEHDVVSLMGEVERYRTAAEDTMHLLDWCIGYFSGSKNAHVAMSLSANRTKIRRQYMQRPAEPTPDEEVAASQSA